jgi:hypothetical protein
VEALGERQDARKKITSGMIAMVADAAVTAELKKNKWIHRA